MQHVLYSKSNTVGLLLFAAYAGIITLLPAVFLLPLFGWDTAFWLIADDAYLYLGIAESSTSDYFSFDGERPTNGFHPLWQWIVWSATQFIGTSKVVLMNFTAWSAVFFVLTGVLLLGVAIRRITGSWALSVFAVPGVYFMLIGQGLDNLAVWNFFNGMEAGLTFALTGVVAYIISILRSDEPRNLLWLTLGTSLALLTMCRLDEVFVAPAIGLAWLIWAPNKIRERLINVLFLGLPLFIALTVYFVYNLTTVGVLMPISGSAKAEGSLIPNIWATAYAFFSPVFDLREWLVDYTGDRIKLTGGVFRVAELVFPAIAAFFFIIIIWQKFHKQAWAPLVVGLCSAIIIKAGYNFLSVNFWHQSAWYFAYACGVFSFTSALIFSPIARKIYNDAKPVGLLILTVFLMISFMQASLSFSNNVLSNEPIERRSFLKARTQIEYAIETAVPGVKILEFGDGIVNYSLDRPVRQGFVFAGDPQSLNALKDKNLLRASYADNFKIITSYEYLRWPNADLNTSSDEIRSFLKNSFLDPRVKSELDYFDFKLVYVYEPLNIPFILLKSR